MNRESSKRAQRAQSGYVGAGPKTGDSFPFWKLGTVSLFRAHQAAGATQGLTRRAEFVGRSIRGIGNCPHFPDR